MTTAKIDDAARLPLASAPAGQTRRKTDMKRATANIAAAFAKMGRPQTKDVMAKAENKGTSPAVSTAQTAATQPTRGALHAPSAPGQGERAASDLIGKIKHLTMDGADKQIAVQEAPLQAFGHARASDNKLAIEAATESFAFAPESDALDRAVVATMTVEKTLQAADQSAPSRQRIKAGIGHALETTAKMAPERREMLAPFLAQAYVQVGGEAQLQGMVAHVAQAANPVAAAQTAMRQALRRGLGKDDAKAAAFMEDPNVKDFLRGGAIDLALMGMARQQGIAAPFNYFGRDRLTAHFLKQTLASIPPAQMQQKPALRQLSRAVNRVVDAMDQNKRATLNMLEPDNEEAKAL